VKAVIANKPFIASIAGLSIFSVLFVFLLIPPVASLETFENSSDSNSLFLHGVYTVIVKDNDGYVTSYQQFENLVPNEGLECSGDLIFGTANCVGEAFFQYIAIGTSASAPTDGDTSLGAESGTCARIQDVTPTMTSPSSGQRQIELSATFSGGTCESQTFAEVGLFDASTSGNMLSRTLLSSTVTLPASSGSTLTINYQVFLNNS
jgi:hypothetical protein